MGQFNYTGLNKYWILCLRWGMIGLLICIWEIGSQTGIIDPYYFSSPSRVVKNIVVWLVNGLVFKHLSLTMSEAGVGFIAGLVLGVTVGFLFATNSIVDTIFQPFIVIMNAMPRIAFAPLIILWFGLGFLSKAVIVISLVFFIVFFNTYRGFKEINPILLKNARVLGATRMQVFLHIYLPATMSWTFASLRVSVGFAIIAAILGEYMGASAGIGYLIDNAQSNFDATGVMSGLVILTIVVVILDSLLKKVEAHFTKWRINNQTTGDHML
ncbi:MAG: ABC transporter permease [Planctomycetes bacterium]|uniref:ABC transporter permease n=1 Tax=Candidatus Wunengus sp. YC65 TaxID=3367701 RepID=UPI001DCBD5FD|nr:ABC transporter permease [Planctomycetota bacterium]